MEFYPLFPLSPSPTIVFATRQIIGPKNILSVVVSTTLSNFLLVQSVIVIVSSSTFSLSGLAYIFYNLAIRIEESYRLVASAGNPDAQCDTLVTIPSKTLADKISLVELSFEGDETISELYWSTGGLEDGFSIIGFPGEFKTQDENDSNRNQLIMVLATAQAQRKALSLRRSIIMGAIASGGHVQIFSSYWSSDESVCS